MSSRRTTTTGPTHVALLRGINVGGRHIVPMAALREAFANAGCTEVATYIQSGNVVFRATAGVAQRIAGVVARNLGKEFGFEPVIVISSRSAFESIVRDNPFVKAGAAVAALHVGFLADAPGAAQARRLDGDRSPGDAFAVRGGVIYLHLPNGVARTKLTSAYLDATLGTTCTVRNWRTTLKLAGMLGLSE